MNEAFSRAVLVTGASGVIGARVTERLQRSGHDVVALVADGRPTSAIHLAAILHPTRPAAQGFVNNTAASFAILEAAGEARIAQVVVSSSLAALGLAFGPPDLRPRYLPLDESHPLLIRDPYGHSKAVAESSASAMMHRRWGTAVCSLRLPFVPSGDRLARRLDEARAGARALRAEVWAYLHTDDAAEYLVRAATEHDRRGFTPSH